MELLDDPSREAGRRVVQSVAERLRVLALDLLVRVARLHERAHVREIGLLIFGELHRFGRRRADHHVQVYARAVLGVEAADLARHHRAPVAALRAVAVVAEAGHQHDPRLRDATDIPTGVVRRARPSVARHRRAHHVERVRGIAAMRARIAQRIDHVEELAHRSRPAVRDHERQRVRLG